MNEADKVARRMRVHLMTDIERVARATEPAALHDTELGLELSAFAEAEHGSAPALTAEEAAAAKALATQLQALWDRAHKLKQERIGGKVVHQLEPEALPRSAGLRQFIRLHSPPSRSLPSGAGWTTEFGSKVECPLSTQSRRSHLRA
jgi:hypothetical protein